MSNFRSPLSAAIGAGSAKDGTSHWWSQRVSAVALLILGAWFAIALVTLDSFDYATVTAWIAEPFTAVALILLCLTMAFHSDLGVAVVIEDYVHGHFVKVASLVLVKFLHILFAMVAVFAVLKIALGGQA